RRDGQARPVALRYARAPAACPRARRREGRAAGQPPRRRSSGGRRLIREEREQAAERVPELAALDDEVELAVLEEELGTLEAVGQRLADRLEIGRASCRERVEGWEVGR